MLARVTFEAARGKARNLKLYEASQELLADAFLRQHSRHGPYSLAELKSSRGNILTDSN